mmetsp:Transcript_91942/g.259749  ORF Transcript_91942/g.259749 Transcript_91942/m.259749 type:complete len:234 (+) Transcript_91942:179-880(+)
MSVHAIPAITALARFPEATNDPLHPLVSDHKGYCADVGLLVREHTPLPKKAPALAHPMADLLLLFHLVVRLRVQVRLDFLLRQRYRRPGIRVLVKLGRRWVQLVVRMAEHARVPLHTLAGGPELAHAHWPIAVLEACRFALDVRILRISLGLVLAQLTLERSLLLKLRLQRDVQLLYSVPGFFLGARNRHDRGLLGLLRYLCGLLWRKSGQCPRLGGLFCSPKLLVCGRRPIC